MIELYVWRHKVNKEIYLIKNVGMCGGGENSEFYKATRSIIEAIKSANNASGYDANFEEWMRSFLDDNGKTRLKARIVDYKEVDFDGYTGRISKELYFPVADFEKITITEVAE